MGYRGFRDLKVYQLSYRLFLEIFDLTKNFPKEELYSLTDQIRRSSRSVPANIAEAWRKRKYPKSFVSKLIDLLSEESETEVWLDYSKDLNYKTKEKYKYFIQKYDEVARMLSSMIENPQKFCY
ncbi:S23 ribosomal protein [Caldithrix abyssi DSM 13497]|uniref:S23 ribosomal protein n=1 Tax=Caldithrix abyssi DSM 13497 TaxID=880073 RepID=H1XRP2_CALAY|nr:four helix bundle protein [Caldithrix abyssi]EHO40195.1 S23 ribosomal protein [Caldithrix abyssi DSM 13497]